MMHVSGVELEASAGLKDAKRRQASTPAVTCSCIALPLLLQLPMGANNKCDQHRASYHLRIDHVRIRVRT